MTFTRKRNQWKTGEMLRPCHRSRAIRGKIDFQVQNEQREKKVVSADKVTMNPQSRDDPREKSGSNVTGITHIKSIFLMD